MKFDTHLSSLKILGDEKGNPTGVKVRYKAERERSDDYGGYRFCFDLDDGVEPTPTYIGHPNNMTVAELELLLELREIAREVAGGVDNRSAPGSGTREVEVNV